MSGAFRPGDRVRVRPVDPDHHTRAPRYVRGATGTVAELHGSHPLPDEVVAGAGPPSVQTVYAVTFPAAELWGEGDHTVTVNLWEAYLTPGGDEEGPRP